MDLLQDFGLIISLPLETWQLTLISHLHDWESLSKQLWLLFIGMALGESFRQDQTNNSNSMPTLQLLNLLKT